MLTKNGKTNMFKLQRPKSFVLVLLATKFLKKGYHHQKADSFGSKQKSSYSVSKITSFICEMYTVVSVSAGKGNCHATILTC